MGAPSPLLPPSSSSTGTAPTCCPACLDALRQQEVPFAFHTWVVDNASKDGSVELMRDRYPDVRVLQSPDNLGFAGGNNLALREVTTPYAVLLNNDAVPEPDWLRHLLAPLQDSAPAATGVGAVTGKVALPALASRGCSWRPRGSSPAPTTAASSASRVSSLKVDGARPLGSVLWERLTYGAEGPPGAPLLLDPSRRGAAGADPPRRPDGPVG